MRTKKTIYLIRHGETDYNKRGIIQGSGVNSQLNQTGLEQALKFYRAYHHLAFDKIYTSELTRAVQSVTPFIDSGSPFEALKALNEISWGVLEGKSNTPENQVIYRRMLKDWRAGLLDSTVEQGESPRQMWNRQLDGFNTMMQRNTEELILVCMHGRSMRSFLCLLTGTPLSEMDKFKHSNLCLYILEKVDDRFEIAEANSTAHLWY